MNSFYRLCHLGPVSSVSCMFVLYTIAVVDSALWLSRLHRSAGALNISCLTILGYFVLFNFIKASLVGPGFVPRGWKPKNIQDIDDLEYCPFCKCFKPPRTHHCRICRRCVFKMDHHCLWLNNCCGHFNQTNYAIFIILLPIAAIYTLFITAVTLWSQYSYPRQQMKVKTVSFSSVALFINVLAISVNFIFLIFSVFLLYRQLNSLLFNATLIERWIIKEAKNRHKKIGKKFVYPYDYGIMKNISQIINWDMKPVGDGYNWPVVEGCNKYALSIEEKELKGEMQSRLVLYDSVEPYSGSCLPFSKGLRICLNFPCVYEPRMPLKPGERVLVGTTTKHWMYGAKVLNETQVNSSSVIRGWFPSCCVEKTPDDN